MSSNIWVVGWSVRHAVTEPRTNLEADFAALYTISPGLDLQAHRSESCWICLYAKLKRPTQSSYEGGFVRFCYKEEKPLYPHYANKYLCFHCAFWFATNVSRKWQNHSQNWEDDTTKETRENFQESSDGRASCVPVRLGMSTNGMSTVVYRYICVFVYMCFLIFAPNDFVLPVYMFFFS